MTDYGAECYRRFLEGDDEGFSEIVRVYRDALFLYLKSVVLDCHAAEELVQDTFFQIIGPKTELFRKKLIQSLALGHWPKCGS